MTIHTEADFNSWRFRKDEVHFTGKDFFAWGHRCVDQPRLLVIDRYEKKNRSATRSYRIDGRVDCPTLEIALAALSSPPQLTPGEIKQLRGLPLEWFYPEKRADLMPLAEQGMVEWRRDKEGVACRVTEAGLQYLKEMP